jgi:hypothetical protein
MVDIDSAFGCSLATYRELTYGELPTLAFTKNMQLSRKFREFPFDLDSLDLYLCDCCVSRDPLGWPNEQGCVRPGVLALHPLTFF